MLARALLNAQGPLSFDELMDAAGERSPGDVAAWLGHAIDEGLVRDDEARFSLKARGRRLVLAKRRAAERAD